MQRREQVLGPALGLTVHPALAPLAKRCLDALEEEAGVDPARRNRGPPVLASTLKELATVSRPAASDRRRTSDARRLQGANVGRVR